MVFLLAATAPMYYEPICYYENGREAAGVATYLNTFVDRRVTDLYFKVDLVENKKKVADIISDFRLEMEGK